MAGPIPAASGRIFISYRREDTAYPAGWLYDRLADRFADGQVFKDVDSIKLGDDFVQVLTAAVGSCDVLLALIGDRWLKVLDDTLAEAQAQREFDAQAQQEAQAKHAGARRAVRGRSGATPSEVSAAGQPTAPPPPPRRHLFDQVLLLRRRPVLLGAGVAAVALVVVLLLKLFGGGEPPDRPLSVRGELSTAGAVNSYPFTGRQGEQVYLDVQECASDGTLTWTLTTPAPDEEALFKEESLCIRGSLYDKGLLTLPQEGSYKLTVQGYGDATGTYRVKLQSR